MSKQLTRENKMAESFYKSLNPNRDIISTRTLLHEAIPLTGTIISGTYINEANIKDYAHGMFQSIYDYPYLSSSANHIFDITVGVSAKSPIYATTNNQASKKKNIYNQMAQVLVGHDATGGIALFPENGEGPETGRKLKEVYFLNFARLLQKDEIKKGSFQFKLGAVQSGVPTQAAAVMNTLVTISDSSGSDGYFVNSPAGEYGVLYATASHGTLSPTILNTESHPVGLIYYQAGIAVLSASLFNSSADFAGLYNTAGGIKMSGSGAQGNSARFQGMLTGSTIKVLSNGLRNRIYNLQFNNVVELNSSIYFCRINHNDYNYSTNPTYLSGSKIVVKTKTTDEPVAYITTVGLYNDNNELLATGKLSEPLKKTPANEITLRVRLDY